VLKDFEDYGLAQPDFQDMENGFRVKVFSFGYSNDKIETM